MFTDLMQYIQNPMSLIIVILIGIFVFIVLAGIIHWKTGCDIKIQLTKYSKIEIKGKKK